MHAAGWPRVTRLDIRSSRDVVRGVARWDAYIQSPGVVHGDGKQYVRLEAVGGNVRAIIPAPVPPGTFLDPMCIRDERAPLQGRFLATVALHEAVRTYAWPFDTVGVIDGVVDGFQRGRANDVSLRMTLLRRSRGSMSTARAVVVWNSFPGKQLTFNSIHIEPNGNVGGLEISDAALAGL